MKKPVLKITIQTLGKFGISVNGNPVAKEWPSERVKVLFCTMISPVDRFVSWDRICHSVWGVPATQSTRLRLKEALDGPLNSYLMAELGFNPLVAGHEGMGVDQERVHVDAFEFYSAAVEGLRLMSLGSKAAAHAEFRRANKIYGGSYLPGFNGIIISDARNDLESLYRTAVTISKPSAGRSTDRSLRMSRVVSGIAGYGDQKSVPGAEAGCRRGQIPVNRRKHDSQGVQ